MNTTNRNEWGQTDYQLEDCIHGHIRITCTNLKCKIDAMDKLNDDRTCGRCNSADVAFADKIGRIAIFVCHSCKKNNKIDSSKVRGI